MSTSKPIHIQYIDNLRVFLISLIVLLHLAITYGGPGSWFYREYPFESIGLMPQILYLVFNAGVQSFALGLFFMAAGYFTSLSYDRKGGYSFLKGRFIRLGIPMVFYAIAINPLIMYAVRGEKGNYGTFLIHYFKNTRQSGVGPLWFVEALLIFSCAYAAFRHFTPPSSEKKRRIDWIPGHKSLALFALTAGIMTFTVRLEFPVGWVFEPLNFQFPHFSQYICMYIAGIMAYRGNWFERLPASTTSIWLKTAVLLIAVFPVFIAFCGFTKGDMSTLGGANWQSMFYSLWEQFVCVGMAAGLTGIFRVKWNTRNTLMIELSRNAYTVYIIHAPVLVFLCLALRKIDMYPLIKFLILSPVVLILNFSLAGMIRRIPGINRIL